jgi:hypothetical protein
MPPLKRGQHHVKQFTGYGARKMNIDRRRFVSTIGAMAAFTAGTPTAGGAGTNAPGKSRFSDENDLDRGWCIARQKLHHPNSTSGAVHQNIVDFWSKPVSAISLANFLPPEISRGVLWFDGFSPKKPSSAWLEYVDSVPKEYNLEWIQEPRYFATCTDDIELLSSTLRSLIIDNRAARALSRTALVDLGSASPISIEPDWAQIILALAPCYDRIIGFYHLEQRGLRHFEALCDRTSPEHKMLLHNAALQCDAVIFTSASLIENDMNLSAKAPTDRLVSELMQQLGHALLDETVLEQIVPKQKMAREKPRAFALGSNTTTVGYPFVDLRNLTRQRELVFGGFGKLLKRPIQPLLIATLASHLAATIMLDQVQGTDFLFLKLKNVDRLSGGDPLELVHLTSLWPFEAEFAPPILA